MSRVRKYRQSCLPCECKLLLFFFLLLCQHKLLPGELRYSIAERMRLAVEMGSRSTTILSRGNEFTFMTDHYPLLQLNRVKDKSGRITWWYSGFTGFECLSWKNAVAARLSLCECCRGEQRRRKSHFLSGNGRKQVVVTIFNKTMNAVSHTLCHFSARVKGFSEWEINP